MKCVKCHKVIPIRRVIRFIFSAEFIEMIFYMPIQRPMFAHKECTS